MNQWDLVLWAGSTEKQMNWLMEVKRMMTLKKKDSFMKRKWHLLNRAHGEISGFSVNNY